MWGFILSETKSGPKIDVVTSPASSFNSVADWCEHIY